MALVRLNWKVTLAILTTISVLMSSSYTMLIPFLPMYLMQELGVSMAEVNWWSSITFSVTFLVSAILAPIWGAMGDRHSRKMMAIRSAACIALTYLLGGLAQTPWQFFGVRVFQGMSAGLWPALLAIISAHAPTNRLGFSMGMMQGGMTAGGVLGPLFGGVLAELFGMRAAFFLASGGLAIITLTLVFFVSDYPDGQAPRPVRASEPVAPAGPNPLRSGVVRQILLAAAIVQMTVLMQQPILPLYVAELRGSMDQIVLIAGVVFSVVGISGVIASPLWGVLGQSWGFRQALYLALISTAVFGIIQALPHDLNLFTIWRFVGGIAFAGVFPAINAVLTQSTDPRSRGQVFGYSFAAQQMGSVLGPFVGAALASYWDNQAVIAASGVFLIPVVIALYLARPRHRASATGGQLL